MDTTAASSALEMERTLPSWVSDLFAALDTMDVDTWMSFLTPDCTFRFGNAPSLYGHEAIREAVAGLFTAIKGINHSELEAWEHPDATICTGMVMYTRHDDSTLRVPFANVFRLRDGLVRQYLIYVDNSQLFA
jgi:ketosteroid isomerase-like protein